MPAAKNALKAALAAKTVQHGIWLNMVSPVAAEVLSGVGFDWLLIDGEHAPNDIPTILSQIHAMGACRNIVVRPPVGDVRLVKQLLDLGVQSLLIPMIDSAEQAAEMVRATRYPPAGIRGVGASVARAADYGRVKDYVTTANEEICLILQIESRAGLAALPAILALDGVDGVFIGPADLAADMGHPGNSAAPAVQSAIDTALADIMASGKSAGILTFDQTAAQRYRNMGVTFLGVGGDVGLLMRAAEALLHTVRQG
jgi:4-hydroxy-2-oxoheptanedioate aldolase